MDEFPGLSGSSGCGGIEFGWRFRGWKWRQEVLKRGRGGSREEEGEFPDGGRSYGYGAGDDPDKSYVGEDGRFTNVGEFTLDTGLDAAWQFNLSEFGIIMSGKDRDKDWKEVRGERERTIIGVSLGKRLKKKKPLPPFTYNSTPFLLPGSEMLIKAAFVDVWTDLVIWKFRKRRQSSSSTHPWDNKAPPPGSWVPPQSWNVQFLDEGKHEAEGSGNAGPGGRETVGSGSPLEFARPSKGKLDKDDDEVNLPMVHTGIGGLGGVDEHGRRIEQQPPGSVASIQSFSTNTSHYGSGTTSTYNSQQYSLSMTGSITSLSSYPNINGDGRKESNYSHEKAAKTYTSSSEE
ncbi:MAG: hypothetical protein NXY57DRAFT_1071756 [Lentinula lateritia]|nr:MAG: hypothetical protein NXY57DRAFT_1071756 [Lentinula lateritia]